MSGCMQHCTFQWLLWMALAYKATLFAIHQSADLKYNNVRDAIDVDVDLCQVPFPTTHSFHHAHFSHLALDLLVRCSDKFQQCGLCLLHNFVK